MHQATTESGFAAPTAQSIIDIGAGLGLSPAVGALQMHKGRLVSPADLCQPKKIAFFKFDWRQLPGMPMAALGVVEHFDVVEHIGPSLCTVDINLTSDSFTLEQLKEAFSNGVIVTIPAPAHARLKTMRSQEIKPIMIAELTTLIAVNDHL